MNTKLALHACLHTPRAHNIVIGNRLMTLASQFVPSDGCNCMCVCACVCACMHACECNILGLTTNANRSLKLQKNGLTEHNLSSFLTQNGNVSCRYVDLLAGGATDCRVTKECNKRQVQHTPMDEQKEHLFSSRPGGVVCCVLSVWRTITHGPSVTHKPILTTQVHQLWYNRDRERQNYTETD